MTILELYGAGACPFTAEMREQLDLDGRTYVEYDVEADPAARDRLVSLSGERMVPALIDGGRVVAIGWRGRGCIV